MKKTLTIIIVIFSINVGYCQFGTQIIIDQTAIGISEIITVDINNDNLKDILVSQKFVQNNKVSAYLNQGNGTFGIQQIIASNISSPLSITSGDFNTDGWEDIVTFSGSLSDGELYLYFNNTGTFPSQIILDTNLFFPQKLKTADIDNDNDADIILITDMELIVYYNDGGGTFTKTVIPAGISTEYYDMAIADIDNDGFRDIIIGGVKTLIYKNTNGTIGFDAFRTDAIPDNNHLVTLVHLDDFDTDGDLDLLNNDNASNLLQWCTNDGLGNFSSPVSIDTNASQIVSITSADFDNDGDADLFTALPQLGKVVWYQNDGAGNFSAPILIYQGTIPNTEEVFSSDLNNDGLQDIIWSQELSIHLNNSILGVDDNELNSTFRIYPNPSSNSINIDTNKNNGKLSIYNSLGQVVTENYPLNSGKNVLTLTLVSGIYMFVVENKNEIEKMKVIIK